MKTQYLPTFLKDLKSLKSASAYELIKVLVFEEIPNCQSFNEIRNLKRLKGAENTCRIDIFFKNETIIFVRVLNRKEIYRYFP